MLGFVHFVTLYLLWHPGCHKTYTSQMLGYVFVYAIFTNLIGIEKVWLSLARSLSFSSLSLSLARSRL